ncbi:MAG: right-handed parallel beta-helix repeat-containing protein, partial [Verrucomicrobia bacterium]|nr:right-handed parallel beta-helix repeat-containing protein [Verrucomicrobiota bacterium]
GSIQAGDTVWLAGGSYSAPLTIQASGSPGSPVTVLRARSTDSAAASAAGWNSSFDSQVAFSGSNWPFLSIPAGHDITVDGRVASGILLQIPSSGGNASQGAQNGNVANVTISNVEIIGPSATSGLSWGRYGFNWAPSSNTVTNVTFDHCIVHQLCEAFRASNWNGVVIQYCTIHDLTTDNVDHDDICYSYPGQNVTWRYNTFYNSPDDGLFFEFGGATNYYFYGNVFYSCTYSMITFKTGSSYGPVFIYNNVFAGRDPSQSYAYIQAQGSVASTTQCYNNVFFNATNGIENQNAVNTDYNAYYPATVNGYSWPSGSEPHSFALGTNPFISSTTGNFHLTAAGAAALQKGLPLTTNGFINKDMDGNTRGGSGGWTIGAYQYSSGSSTQQPTPTPPPPPTGLRIAGS